jgi:hypothetical protein
LALRGLGPCTPLISNNENKLNAAKTMSHFAIKNTKSILCFSDLKQIHKLRTWNPVSVTLLASRNGYAMPLRQHGYMRLP